MTAAASHIFAFYANLLSVESKYGWNNILVKQMERNPCVDLQGVSQEGPRGMSRDLFDNCVLFHLLTVFPINAAEQEKTTLRMYLRSPSASMYTSLDAE
jgi:hypothetical protein